MSCLAHGQQFHRLTSAVVLPGANPEWDYLALDAARNYLFIARRGAGAVVYDTHAQKIVSVIAQSEDANAITLVPQFDRGYTTNNDGSVTAFELSTLRSLGRIKIGDDADAGFYDPATGQLAITMGDSRKLAFLDARTGAPSGEVPIDSQKIDAAVADGTGMLFVALRDRNRIARVDARRHRVDALWPTAPCEEPTGMAVDTTGRRLFVGCRGSRPLLAVFDTQNGRPVAMLDIGRGNDGVAFDAVAHRVYTSNGVDANLVAYEQRSPDEYRLLEATTTRPYARTMALDPTTKSIYLVTAEGTVDPTRKINKAVANFYPNRYFDDTFTVLTYELK